MDIMEVRFQGRLETSILIEDNVRDALVPNLVLQPLVENAFKHGGSVDEGRARVEVRAHRAGNDLVLSVSNTGPAPTVSPDGVGLANTRNRLRELYGASQTFELRAAEGGGAIAEIRLPYHTRSATNAIDNG
jgi:LytS/YehU family sensor histidine kinase